MNISASAECSKPFTTLAITTPLEVVGCVEVYIATAAD